MLSSSTRPALPHEAAPVARPSAHPPALDGAVCVALLAGVHLEQGLQLIPARAQQAQQARQAQQAV